MHPATTAQVIDGQTKEALGTAAVEAPGQAAGADAAGAAAASGGSPMTSPFSEPSVRASMDSTELAAAGLDVGNGRCVVLRCAILCVC